jgi:WD40 repeat protein
LDGCLRSWNLSDGSRICTMEGHTDRVSAVALCPDGRIVSGSWDRTVRLWDHEGRHCMELSGHHGKVTAVAVMPDGRVVSGSSDHCLRIWDVDAGRAQVVFGNSVFTALAVADGLIVAGDATGNVWFVDVPPRASRSR